MVRMVLVSVALLGLVCYFIFRWQAMVTAAQPPLTTRIDVHADRLVYRNGDYASDTALAIALQANNQLPEIVEVHGCAAVRRLPGVLEVIRTAGARNFEILLPDDC